MNFAPTQPSTPFSHRTPYLHLLFPVFLSSPSNPKIPPNPHQPNNIILSKSWHSSFPPRRIIKSVSKTNQTRQTSRVFAFITQVIDSRDQQI
jgi:hypothetical protein